MAIGAALALLAGGMRGYSARQRDDEDRQRREKDDAWREEQRTRQRTAWQREDEKYAVDQQEQQAVRQAMAPVVADASPVAAPIGSRDEPRAPEDQGIRVAGQTFTDPAAASKAAEAANALPARMARAAAATRNPQAAAQLLETGQRAELGTMQMAAAKKQAEDQAKVQDIVGTLAQRGAEAIPEIYSRYNDGMTAVVVPGEKGGFTVKRTGKDGKPAGEQQFAGMEDFIATAVARMNPDLYMRNQETRRKEAQTQANADRDYELKKIDTATRGQRENRMAQAFELQAQAALITARNRGSGGGGGGGGGLDMGGADKFINSLFTSKDETTGRTTFDPQGAQVVRGLMLGMPAAQAGDTQGAVNQALAAYNKALKNSGGDHEQAVKLLQSAMAPKQAAPAPASQEDPARAPMRQAAAAQQSAPASAEQPGLVSRLASKLAEMNRAAGEEAVMVENIRKKVRARQALTPQEQALATRYTIM